MNKTDKITMRVTEEEYNDIYPILINDKLAGSHTNNWSDKECYLVNIRNGDLEGVQLYNNSCVDYTHRLLPYNKKIFLKYCGIETEQEETFEEYTKRVSPSLFSSFLAEKELKNRKYLFTTEDGVKIYVGDKYYFGVEDSVVLVFTANSLTYLDNKKRFSTKEKAEQYLYDKTTLYKSEDGFDIFKGDTVYFRDHPQSKNGKGTLFSMVEKYTKPFIPIKGLYKHEMNAINDIVLNKKCLSIKDLDSITGSGNEKLELINKVKKELGFN